jgi:hypothetical protein
VFAPRTSVYLTDQFGTFTAIGCKPVKMRAWFFLKSKDVERPEYFDETIRHAIQNLPRTSLLTHVVLIQHGQQHFCVGDERLTRLTVFKPPQKGVTLQRWYDNKVTEINEAVAKEVENA